MAVFSVYFNRVLIPVSFAKSRLTNKSPNHYNGLGIFLRFTGVNFTESGVKPLPLGMGI